MMKKTLLAWTFLAITLLGQAQVNNTYSLMPVPAQLTENGQPLAITAAFKVSVKGRPDARLYAEASRFVRRLSNKTGIFLDKQGYVTTADTALDAPLLLQVQRPGKLVLGENEAYTITTTTKQVLVTAVTDLGAIHALETLLQLVSTNNRGYYIPGVAINDRPPVCLARPAAGCCPALYARGSGEKNFRRHGCGKNECAAPAPLQRPGL